MAKAPQIDIMRSPLGRARGLGAAKAGAVHWWVQRLTSLALVPLTLWFLCAVIRLLGATRDDVVYWMAGPLPIVLLIALVIATFHHLQAGLQVVIEDYVHHDWLRIGSVLLVKGLSVLLALACIVAVLRLGL
ncbi:MAG TPA: succinate dehydrogenase, hydrophobic membrane anchor protein [Acetobacteraceae bacterium]|jgi:succinate dehydrogenase / fumarate reductase membrane anchor subunit|nr:succinate dehydrogenase, hydrophobic membrane anchor protein [Acetobacteraceae bacterium]